MNGGGVPCGWFDAHTGRFEPSPAVVEYAVRVLMAHMGADPTLAGLRDTPGRVARMLKEMTGGYRENPGEILGRVFDEPCDEVVAVCGIPFASLCEHHLLPFTGTVDVGYLPREGGPVVGLSKIPRLVDCFARRLQVQERLTREIAWSLQEHVGCRGVAAVLRAEHSCLSCRGARKPGVTMVTSVMLGVFRENPAARQEFLTLCGGSRTT